ncbi:S24 family peptidase [Brevibacillus centrosporus]|uniref:S24 family peptidase n=1 Tax=Brevibacillus centrosporus TaxID=54910 RepID=UPI00398619AE
MGYKELLSNMISNSNLKLKEIADKCEEIGVKINPSYISRLQTGNQAPASDEVNTAIATVCGGDVELLRFEASVEKSPDIVKTFVNEVTSYFRETTKQLFSAKLPEAVLPIVLEQIDSMSKLDIVNNFLKMDKADGLENKAEINMGPRIEDDSMEPLIPKGAIINLEKETDIKNGDYIVVEIEEVGVMIRRIVIIDENIVLLPENSAFECLETLKKRVKILGKVIGYTLTKKFN